MRACERREAKAEEERQCYADERDATEARTRYVISTAFMLIGRGERAYAISHVAAAGADAFFTLPLHALADVFSTPPMLRYCRRACCLITMLPQAGLRYAVFRYAIAICGYHTRYDDDTLLIIDAAAPSCCCSCCCYMNTLRDAEYCLLRC